MGAVSVAVGRVAAERYRVIPGERATAEVRMREPDSGIDNVNAHTRAVVRVQVGVVEWPVELVDAVQSPRRGVVLGVHQLHLYVLLDVGDRRVGREPARRRLAQLDGVAVEGGAVDTSD